MKKIEDLKLFLDEFEATFRPLYVGAGERQFEALTTGDEKKYAEAVEFEVKIQNLLSRKDKFIEAEEFNRLEDLDAIQERQVFEIYRAYLSHQADPELMRQISELDSEVSQDYSTFRVKKGDIELTDNDILEILENSNNSAEVEEIWNSSKEVGALVADKVVKLAKLRNQLAISLNFKNYWEMSLVLQDFEPMKLLQLFDDLDRLTAAIFAKIKHDLDEKIAEKFNLSISELAPSHFGRYFQQSPKIFDLDLDATYLDQDLTFLTDKYYKSIGLSIDKILAKSDLYEKKGKNQHAFCFGIDAPDDVRVLCNVKPNAMWMDTMLHEFGHGVYDHYLDKNMPWSLRSPAHIFTTEAIAMMFGTLSANPTWIERMLDKKLSAKEAEETALMTKYDKIIFSRFVQVMFRFEKDFYENPDQNLDDLWWKLVEKYQCLKRPIGERKGDWASKMHIASAPVYYHNYLLGELFAAQLRNYIKANISANASLSNDVKIGDYLKERVFAPGQKYVWGDFVKSATDKELTPKYFAEEFCI
ncbi:MAG: M2 family metallopeptidase [bacterium]